MAAHDSDTATVTLDGITFNAMTMSQVVDHVTRQAKAGIGGTIVTPNVDIMLWAKRNTGQLFLAQADLLVPDGMPLIWASKLQGTPLRERVTGADLVFTLSERAAKEDLSVFLLGAAPGVADEAAVVFKRRFPGLKVAGTYSPPLGFESDDAQMSQIATLLADSGAQLVFLAFGSPKQERVALQLRDRLHGTWFLGCGGALDMAAGRVERAHPMIQRLGGEWVHRLVKEPRRMARRYLVDDAPYAVSLLARSALRGRANRGRHT